MGLAKGLSILFIFSKKQFLVLLIFTLFIYFSFIFAQIFIISFLLLILFLFVVVALLLFPVVLGVKLGYLVNVFLVS